MLLGRALCALAAYASWKAVLRQFTGSEPDSRGWGLETYVSAFCHQIATTLLGVWLVAAHHTDLDAWLVSSWRQHAEHQQWEQLLLIMQAAEMATDMVRDLSYPGFGSSYLAHHCATLVAALAALGLTVPVGGVVGFATCMEAGGATLNFVSLYPLATAPAAPKRRSAKPPKPAKQLQPAHEAARDRHRGAIDVAASWNDFASRKILVRTGSLPRTAWESSSEHVYLQSRSGSS